MLYNEPWMAERDAVGDFIRCKPESVVEVTRHAIMSASKFSAADAFKAFYRIKELRVATNATWSEVDAIFVPTTPTIYRIDEVLKDPAATNGRLSHYTNFVNLLDLCAVAVPSAFYHKWTSSRRDIDCSRILRSGRDCSRPNLYGGGGTSGARCRCGVIRKQRRPY